MRTARPDDWTTLPLPEKSRFIQLDRVFNREQVSMLRLGVVPEEMEDKWFIYWLGNSLYFHRSWTGFCIYVVELALADDGSARIVSVLVNRDREQYSSVGDEQDAEVLETIIDVLLLREESRLLKDASPKAWFQTNWTVLGRAMFTGAGNDADAGVAKEPATEDEN